MKLNFIDIPELAEADAQSLISILVCGSRDFLDNSYTPQQVFDTLDEIRRVRFPNNQLLIINGWANGVDLTAAEWAESRKLPFLSVPADWDVHKKLAGFYRNERMLTIGRPDIVIAFPGNNGTKDMIARTKRRHIELIEVTYE